MRAQHFVQCWSTEDEGTAYYGDHGAKCIIGSLMTDQEYRDAGSRLDEKDPERGWMQAGVEGHSIRTVLQCGLFPKANARHDIHNLLTAMQATHDRATASDPVGMCGELAGLAKRYGWQDLVDRLTTEAEQTDARG